MTSRSAVTSASGVTIFGFGGWNSGTHFSPKRGHYFVGGTGDSNLYRYVNNDATITDPSGLQPDIQFFSRDQKGKAVVNAGNADELKQVFLPGTLVIVGGGYNDRVEVDEKGNKIAREGDLATLKRIYNNPNGVQNNKLDPGTKGFQTPHTGMLWLKQASNVQDLSNIILQALAKNGGKKFTRITVIGHCGIGNPEKVKINAPGVMLTDARLQYQNRYPDHTNPNVKKLSGLINDKGNLDALRNALDKALDPKGVLQFAVCGYEKKFDTYSKKEGEWFKDLQGLANVLNRVVVHPNQLMHLEQNGVTYEPGEDKAAGVTKESFIWRIAEPKK